MGVLAVPHIGDAAAEEASPASSELGYTPPSYRGFIRADLHITHVDREGKTHGSWVSADGPRPVDPVAIPPLAFYGTRTLGTACKQSLYS